MTLQDRVQSLQSSRPRGATEQHGGQTNVLVILVGNISSLVTCVQLNVAILTVHFNYIQGGVLDTRVNPDTCGQADSIRIRKKSLRIQKYPDTCGRI